MTQPCPSVSVAARTLLDATSRLPAGAAYHDAQAITRARRTLLAAFEAADARLRQPRARRAAVPAGGEWESAGPDTGAVYPAVAREWRRADGAFVRLVLAIPHGWTPPYIAPDSIAARTPMRWRGPIGGHYSVWAGPGAYKGRVDFRAGDKAAAVLPVAAIEKVLARSRTYVDNVCVIGIVTDKEPAK